MKRYNSIFKILEDITDVPVYAWDELARYNKMARRVLDSSIIKYFDEFLPNKPITVYRGLGFDVSDAQSVLKKLRIKKLQDGATGVYKTGKIQSWSLDANVAEMFAGKFTIAGRDEFSLGIIIKIERLDPKDIAIPIAFLDKSIVKKYLRFDQSEILVKPGNYKIEIVKLLGTWEDASSLNLKDIIKKVALKIQKNFGGKIEKTWNKQPGFSLQISKIQLPYEKKTWSPSISLHVDGTSCYVDVAHGFSSNDRAYKIYKAYEKQFGGYYGNTEFGTVKELAEYLQSKEFFDKFKLAYNIIIQMYKYNETL